MIVRTPLDWTAGPADAALLVRGDDRPFALCGAWAGGGAIAGSEPVRVAREDEDPFALLDELPVIDAGEGFGGGWVGYLGYGLGRRVEDVSAPPPRPVALPEFVLAYYDHVVRCDREGRWWFEALWTADRDEALRARLEELRARVAERRTFATAPWRSMPSPDGHAAAVALVRERIHAGDLFQANVCLRLESRLYGDATDLFTAGVRELAPERAAFVSGPWGSIASLSPELFLARRGRRVLSAPIKGTARERAALATSDKDRAENVMIVDLVRNDLGRVCEPGSVRVEALCEPRAHTGVWHLVSEVAGETSASNAALVRAAFPPGSVTGAPKVAAMDVIAEVESTGREAYTGAIGFASPVAGLELNVAIRTFEVRGERVWLGAGGGVVADSDPAAEAAEAATKAAPLLAAIGGKRAVAESTLGERHAAAGRAAIGGEREDATVRHNALPLKRLAPRPAPRPDPALGVFETLRADADPAPHLARLAASVRELYGYELPELELPSGDPDPPARLRIVATPDGVSVERAPLPAPEPVRLRTVTVPGGLGRHKWRDRRLLDALAAAAPGELPLLLDLDGLVLEAARANVFARLADGALVTPPDDGRILPGITRAKLLAREGSERALTLDELRAANQILLTGALRGVERAAALDGRPLGAAVALEA